MDRHDRPMIVGVDSHSAVSDRYSRLPHIRAKILRVYSGTNLINRVRRKVFRQHLTARDLLSTLDTPPHYPRVDLMHLFNTLSIGSAPWVVTYEHDLPRWDHTSARGMSLLLRPSCRKILAMSTWAFQEQLHFLDRFPQWKGAIQEKMCIVHPPQAALISSYDEKTLPADRIVFTFVGRAFFRKGGLESVLAITRLVKEGLPVHLNIVSSMNPEDNPTPVSDHDLQEAFNLISALGAKANYVHEMSNDQVSVLLRASHVALLPTTCDTYGFSVLESQAAGTPVISTEQRVMPEINTDAVGWRIPVPDDGRGNVLASTVEERRQFTTVVVERLCEIVREIVRSPAMVRARGTRALEQIQRDFSPVDRADQLEQIYEEALRPMRAPAASTDPRSLQKRP